MALFVLSSKDGWVSLMYQGIDAVGVDMQVHFPRLKLLFYTLELLCKLSSKI